MADSSADFVATDVAADFSLVCSVVTDVEALATDVQLSLPVALMLLLAANAANPLDLADATMVATETDAETDAETHAILADVLLATERFADAFGFQKSNAAKFQFVLPSSVAKKSLTLTV